MAVPFDTIGRGLWTLLEILVLSFTPVLLLGLGIRCALAVLSYLGEMITGAFKDPPPPLTREQFEEKYGPLELSDIELGQQVIQRTKPTWNLMMWFLLLWALCWLPFFLGGISEGPLVVMATTLLWLATATFCLMIIAGMGRKRYPGMCRKDWVNHIRDKYNVAQDDRIGFRLAIAASGNKKS